MGYNLNTSIQFVNDTTSRGLKHTIDEGPQVLHVPNVLICWVFCVSNLLEKLFAETFNNVGPLGEDVHGKGQSTSSLPLIQAACSVDD